MGQIQAAAANPPACNNTILLSEIKFIVFSICCETGEVGKICDMTSITLQITNCQQHFTLSPLATSKPVLTFSSIGYHVFRTCPRKHQQRQENWSSDTPHFLERGLRIGPQGPKASYDYLQQTALQGQRAGLAGHRTCTRRPQATCSLGLVAAALFTPSGVFLVCCYKYESSLVICWVWGSSPILLTHSHSICPYLSC